MPLKFGTSGVRGLVIELTDIEVYLFTRAFIQYLKSKCSFTKISVSGDLRSSSPRIIRAVNYAINESGIKSDYCGYIPSPAVILHGIVNKNPSIMVTGSHIPDDRNGIKFNMPRGEVLKTDELEIIKNYNKLKKGNNNSYIFDNSGFFCNTVSHIMPEINNKPKTEYIERYLNFFSKNILSGLKIIVYQHSSVSREILCEVMEKLGAEIIKTGYSDKFVPVDTEAVENLDVLSSEVKKHNADALVSADGDGDRPLLISDTGDFMRGDIMGILTSEFLKADYIATPISSNTGVAKSGKFKKIVFTQIGSPYVIDSMNSADKRVYKNIVGYEANGGFLLNSDITSDLTGKTLKALPTRDALLPLLSVLVLSKLKNKKISELISELPNRFTDSGILRNFPSEKGKSIVTYFKNEKEKAGDKYLREFGNLKQIDFTDGCRITFDNEDIIHFRPSGNAPEFRCYTESDTLNKSAEINSQALKIIEKYFFVL